VAIFGSILTNSFGSSLRAILPPEIANGLTPEQFARLANPQALMNPAGTNAVLRGVADPNGPAGELYLEAIRQALAFALHNVFLLSGALQVATVILLVLLLRDVPLRGSAPQRASEAHTSVEA
jgi:hypothetical protein